MEIKRIAFEQFIETLNRAHSRPIYIKMLSEAEHLQSLANGHICLSTLEHFRKCDLQDGRGDGNESCVRAMGVGGSTIVLGNTMTYTDKTPLHQGVTMIVESVLRGLVFCVFRYVPNKSSNENLLACLKDLGQYCLLMDDEGIKRLYKADLVYEKTLACDRDDFVPFIKPYQRKCGPIHYVANPNSLGLQKKDLEIYKRQQEYRIIYSFYNKDNWLDETGNLDARFIFSTEPPQTLGLFEVELPKQNQNNDEKQ